MPEACTRNARLQRIENAIGQLVYPMMIGLPLMAIGSGALLYIYAWSSMVDPSLSPTERRDKIIAKMIDGDAIIPTMIIGVGLVVILIGFVRAAISYRGN